MTTSKLDENSVLRIPENILWRKDDEKVVLFNEEHGEPFILNETGTRMWELVSEGHTIAEILKTLHEEYEGEPETIRDEVVKLIEELLEGKLVSTNAE